MGESTEEVDECRGFDATGGGARFFKGGCYMCKCIEKKKQHIFYYDVLPMLVWYLALIMKFFMLYHWFYMALTN